MWTAAPSCPDDPIVIPAFSPGRALRSPHVQTILGSRGRGYWVQRRAASLLERAEQRIITTGDGVQLEAWTSLQGDPAPGIILIHGWTGKRILTLSQLKPKSKRFIIMAGNGFYSADEKTLTGSIRAEKKFPIAAMNNKTRLKTMINSYFKFNK